MREYFDYIKGFSIKKKIVLILSVLVFLYETFAGVYIICDYISADLSAEISDVLVNLGYPFMLLAFPIMLCAYFKLSIISAYCVIFPSLYLAFNILMFYKKRYKKDVMVLDFVLQLTHPVMLLLLIWAFIAFINIVFDVNLLEPFLAF
ncbi:MAG: hypothetical protein K2H13_10405 [Eubacterium sp.]|nr:hypothetical protein [Eubacterium sp.]MDE6155503.1 hypothetical protein [Eubacterium sp.]